LIRRLFILFILAWIGLTDLTAQDPQFSQFYSNPLYLAPSFAGAAGGNRICANVRDQWAALPSTFMTYSFSYDYFYPKFNSGFGLLAYKDVAGTGDLGTLSVGAQYSYNFKIFPDVYARPGLHFSYREHGLAWDKLTFIDEVLHSPSTVLEPPPVTRVRDVDLALSVLIYSKRVWGGLTVDHLLTPNVSLYADKHEVPVKISSFGGVEIVRKSKLLKPDEETMTVAYLFKHQGP
jgi:type IX secretion system PorP/SprF family membrane protein